MNSFSFIVLGALIAGLMIEYWLLRRQAQSVVKHREQVPAAFADTITLEQHQKAARYTLAKIQHTRVELFLGAIILLAWIFGGGIEVLAVAWQTIEISPLWQGIGLIMSVLIIGSILDIPLSLWNTFGIERSFGFNRTTPLQYLVDFTLQLVLIAAFGVPLLAAILWIMESMGSFWWLAAWAVWMGFTLLITWAYPTLIAPLFNKFKALEDPELRTRLEQLLSRCGFKSDGMFVMDGSRRSAHGNAYFTGFGKNKRIVFFDTLLDGLGPEEVEAVLAHELGHFKRRHVLKNLLVMAGLSLAGMSILGWLIHQPWFFSGLNVSVSTNAVALILFVLVLPLFTVFLTPVMSAFSRKHEYEADSYAAEQVNAEALIEGLVKMYRDNASTLTPDPIYSAFHHSHPPAALRIAHLSSRI
ncbi:MAG: M48 family metallopeptidase [bacterium]